MVFTARQRFVHEVDPATVYHTRRWYICKVDKKGRIGYPLGQLGGFKTRTEAVDYVKQNLGEFQN